MTKHYDTVDLKNPRCADDDIDPEMFFATKGDNRITRAAREICYQCPALEPCRAFALSHSEIQYGVWGGLSMKEILRIRAQIRRERRRAKQAA